jgi:hypothetical protein
VGGFGALSFSLIPRGAAVDIEADAIDEAPADTVERAVSDPPTITFCAGISNGGGKEDNEVVKVGEGRESFTVTLPGGTESVGDGTNGVDFGDGPVGEICLGGLTTREGRFGFVAELGFRGGRRRVIPVLPGIRTLNADGTFVFSVASGTTGTAATAIGAAEFIELGGTTFLAVAGSSSFKCG